MPRRSILSAADRESLLALPDNRDDLIRRYTLSPSDIAVIRQRRGATNRLGFAVLLSYLRYPGVVLGVDQLPFPPLLHLVAGQLKIRPVLISFLLPPLSLSLAVVYCWGGAQRNRLQRAV